MVSQADKATAFRALHERPGAFLIPNPWDVGSAVILQGMGFEALATTSAGHVFTLAKIDGEWMIMNVIWQSYPSEMEEAGTR